MQLYKKRSVLELLNPWTTVAGLYRSRSLLRQFTWRSIQMQHKGSALGVLWSVLSPLLLFGAYTFVFVVAFEGRYGVIESESRTDYAIGMFLSLSLIQLFLESLSAAPLLVVANPNYVKKVVFPLEILPVASVGAALFRCLVSLVLVIVAVACWGPGLTPTAFWLIPILLGLILLSLGISWILAALGVFLRDLAPFVQFAAVMIMFMSAVFYSFERIPASLKFLRLNPLVTVAEGSRAALIWHQSPPFMEIFYLFCSGAMLAVAGYALFSVLKTAFSDVI